MQGKRKMEGFLAIWTFATHFYAKVFLQYAQCTIIILHFLTNLSTQTCLLCEL